MRIVEEGLEIVSPAARRLRPMLRRIEGERIGAALG
jgi:hypothetical protein